MSLRSLVVLGLAAIGALAIYSWSRTTALQRPQAPAPSNPPATAPELVIEPGGDPGIEWTVPERWNNIASGTARIATYVIPGGKGAEEARCAVYYFGPGQGGDASANIERWIGEFAEPVKPVRSSKTIDGMQISIVRIRGTYLAHATMAEESGARADHQLYAAIVDGPNGPVFFKLIGPGKVVDAAAGEFEKLLDSVCRKVA